MGTGSSRTKVKKFDKGNQMPPLPPPEPKPILSTSSPSKGHSSLPKPMPSKSIGPRLTTHDDIFEVDSNVEEYTSVWDHDTKLSSTFRKSVKSGSNNIERHQKETLDNKWSKKNTTNFDSVHIESIIDSQTHSSINLSSSERIDEYINNLNHIHTQLDEKIKRRTEQISNDTESVLLHVRNETQQKQQRLLNYAKQKQLKQDENYQKILEEYIAQLDEIKAKELADLHHQLQAYRQQIFQESQIKIMTVNDQANAIKAKILREEQERATEKIDSIIAQIEQISSDEKLQFLGSESITKTNIITNLNSGTKATGQGSHFDVDENDLFEQRPQAQNKQVIPQRSRKILEDEQNVTQSIRKSSLTQKPKQQQQE